MKIIQKKIFQNRKCLSRNIILEFAKLEIIFCSRTCKDIVYFGIETWRRSLIRILVSFKKISYFCKIEFSILRIAKNFLYWQNKKIDGTLGFIYKYVCYWFSIAAKNWLSLKSSLFSFPSADVLSKAWSSYFWRTLTLSFPPPNSNTSRMIELAETAIQLFASIKLKQPSQKPDS